MEGVEDVLRSWVTFPLPTRRGAFALLLERRKQAEGLRTRRSSTRTYRGRGGRTRTYRGRGIRVKNTRGCGYHTEAGVTHRRPGQVQGSRQKRLPLYARREERSSHFYQRGGGGGYTLRTLWLLTLRPGLRAAGRVYPLPGGKGPPSTRPRRGAASGGGCPSTQRRRT